jgi:hypothetical protein
MAPPAIPSQEPAPIAPVRAAPPAPSDNPVATSAPEPAPVVTAAAAAPIPAATSTVHGPLRATKKTNEASAPPADPFAGKRR